MYTRDQLHSHLLLLQLLLKLLDIPLAFIAENQDSDSELTTQHTQVRTYHPDPAQATCQSSGPV